MKKDIILAGVGGQGILSIATVIAYAATVENLFIKQAEVHGMSQRGGDVMSCLRLSSRPIASDLIPSGQVDLIISLEPMEALRYAHLLADGGRVITSSEPFVNIPNYPPVDDVLAELRRIKGTIMLPAEEIARSVATPRAANMALLGATAPFTGIDPDVLRKGIRHIFAAKGDALVDSNIAAFNAGLDYSTASIS